MYRLAIQGQSDLAYWVYRQCAASRASLPIGSLLVICFVIRVLLYASLRRDKYDWLVTVLQQNQ